MTESSTVMSQASNTGRTADVTISVVIPTYNRSLIVLDAIANLLEQKDRADEIIIVDQTEYRDGDPVAEKIKELHDGAAIKWLQRATPSIPGAMNAGLLQAKSDYVLFIDDDSRFSKSFIASYRRLAEEGGKLAIVGQVLQPGEEPVALPANYRSGNGIWRDLHFKFNTREQHKIADCIACNFLVHRGVAIECGGFDEQFNAVAYRFETEFCRRLVRETEKLVHFEPKPKVNHLKVSSGGTRASVANFLVSSSPVHSQGDYYFAFREATGVERLAYISRRFFGSIYARYYLSHPWWIPVRLIGELRGLLSALKKYNEGPILIQSSGKNEVTTDRKA